MPAHTALAATTRVALAAYLHDIGKLAQRAGAFDGDPRLEVNLQLYCPSHEQGQRTWFTHHHAAHSALAIDLLERHLPDLLGGDVYPFAARRHSNDALSTAQESTDSLINAAAAHHKPRTFLQWVIATADRVASGFEREEFEAYNRAKDETDTGRNHFQARQLTLFESIRLGDKTSDSPQRRSALEWRYPLAVLSPAALFPKKASECEPSADAPAKAEYKRVWDWFVKAIESIPSSHRSDLTLWMDHFDGLWMAAAHAVPAATAFNVRPEVSLYDHSRTTAALAAALWRWHEAHQRCDAAAAEALRTRADFAEQKFVLIQGDFFGIQDFIFAAGGQTRKQAAKLLRGRSLQVSLFTEVAALRILEALGLPSVCQVINAAGKFLIVAPNTAEVIETLEQLRSELAQWFEQQAFGMAGIGLAWERASCQDFLRGPSTAAEGSAFSRLLERLHRRLDREKYHRFDLAQTGARVFTQAAYPHGPCAWNGRLPADRLETLPDGQVAASCALSRDQIRIGSAIVCDFDRLLLIDAEADATLHDSAHVQTLELPLFGYRLAFTRSEEVSGRFGHLAQSGALRRCWDYSLPAAPDAEGSAPLFNGYARRFVSGYVPRVTADQCGTADRYQAAGVDELTSEEGELCTFDMLACEDRELTPDGKWRGIAALAVLKGDIDDLGEIFRVGLEKPSFAKWAALSRQVNNFFAIHVPWLLAHHFPTVYTVFAGGDDFFFIGPWRTTQRLARQLQQDFERYVSHNPQLHFSAGVATFKHGAPIPVLAELGEDALAMSKKYPNKPTRSSGVGTAVQHKIDPVPEKNAITCFGETVAWGNWEPIEKAQQELERLRQELNLPAGYVYGLLHFIDMKTAVDEGKPDAAIWRARLTYRTVRLLERQLRGRSAEQQVWLNTLMKALVAEGIERLGSTYRIPLFTHLYRYRDR